MDYLMGYPVVPAKIDPEKSYKLVFSCNKRYFVLDAAAPIVLGNDCLWKPEEKGETPKP